MVPLLIIVILIVIVEAVMHNRTTSGVEYAFAGQHQQLRESAQQG